MSWFSQKSVDRRGPPFQEKDLQICQFVLIHLECMALEWKRELFAMIISYRVVLGDTVLSKISSQHFLIMKRDTWALRCSKKGTSLWGWGTALLYFHLTRTVNVLQFTLCNCRSEKGVARAFHPRWDPEHGSIYVVVNFWWNRM